MDILVISEVLGINFCEQGTCRNTTMKRCRTTARLILIEKQSDDTLHLALETGYTRRK
ncbi:hypothetical protein J6590_079479 [Homalodisca vitripennis]|nr:hypothetical protein J6590_079479 [Homalodisca vitripennis]